MAFRLFSVIERGISVSKKHWKILRNCSY